jgi:excisionase family DNA binding protein
MAPNPKSSSAKRAAQPDEGPAALTIDQVAAALSCSVPTVYRLVSDGHLTTFLIGRKRYASPRALHACVERLEQLGAVLPSQSGGNNRTGPGKNSEAPSNQEA